MTRYCEVTKKLPLVGNNVSHANNKTKRRFLPNLQTVSFFSDILNRKIRLRLSAKGIKTIESKGGFDNFILNEKNSNLGTGLKKYKEILVKRVSVQQ